MKDLKTAAVSGKKKILLASVAILLAIALCVGIALLFIPRDPALSFRGVSVDSEMYAFWFSMLKTDFMRAYGLKSSEDTPALWAAQSDVKDKTWGELLNEKIHEAIKLRVVAAMLYDELGLQMTVSQRKSIQSYYDDMLTYVADGDRAKMDALTEKYGTSAAAIRRCAAFDLKADLLYYHLSLNDGEGMRAEELIAYYTENYKRVKVLYVNNEKKAIVDASGVRVETPLTELEQAANAQQKAALDVHFDLTVDGVAFGKSAPTVEEFENHLLGSDEALHAEGVYPNGLYVTRKLDLVSPGVLEEKVYLESLDLDEGDFMRVETETGVCYILGYALDTAPYNRKESAVFFSNFFEGAASRALTERAKALLSEVKETPENLAGISVETIPCNLEFKFCSMN